MLPTRPLFLLLGALAACLLAAAPASADTVLRLSESGAAAVEDPFAPPVAQPAAPSRRAARSTRGPATARAAARRGPSVRGELRRMLRRGEIDRTTYAARRADYDDAASFARRAPGRRGVEMSAVVGIVDALAARRELTAGRLPVLWLTLARNREWWSDGPLLSSGQRVTFDGSETLWQYVPGQGLHLHPLANFGRLNGLWQGGRRYSARMQVLLDELLAVRVPRAGGVAWEYYFDFGPSRMPWVSGMAQGTAVQALARAATRLGREADVMPVAEDALGIFTRRPPQGVRVRPRGGGSHFLLYSGDRRLRVLNGFLQALSGLDEYARLSGSSRARVLYESGRTGAERELRDSDTGAWSLYSLGRVSSEASLSYHELVVSFLDSLCERTGEALWCDANGRFAGYLQQPPELDVRSRRVRAGRAGRIAFALSKRSAVTVSVSRDGRPVSSQSLGWIGYGRRSIPVTPPGRRSGRLTVTWKAVDQAGNEAAGEEELEVLRAPRKRRGRG